MDAEATILDENRELVALSHQVNFIIETIDSDEGRVLPEKCRHLVHSLLSQLMPCRHPWLTVAKNESLLRYDRCHFHIPFAPCGISIRLDVFS